MTRERLQVGFWPFQVRAWQSERKIVAVVGGTGSGKCTAPDTPITLADGSVLPARELVGRRFRLMSMVDDVPTAVDAFAEWNEYEPLLRVTTDRGRVAARNAAHPLWSATKHRKRGTRIVDQGWRAVDELRVGDLVAVPRNLPTEANDTLPDYEVKALAYLIGDGGCTSSHVSFTQLPGRQLEEFRECAAEFGCVVERVKYSDVDHIVRRASPRTFQRRPVSNPIATMLEVHGVRHTKSRDKRVPPAIFRLSPQQIRTFLSRLYATDGWAASGQIGFATASRQLAQDVQALLVRCGIPASLETKRASWTVSITQAEDVIRFSDEIGIFGKEDAVARERAIKAAQTSLRRWRRLDLPEDLHWETIRSIETLTPERTVAICVPGSGNYLTDFWEHNTWFAPKWVHKKLVSKPEVRGIGVGTGYNTHVVRVMWYEIEKYLREVGEPYVPNKRDQTITLRKNGSQLMFGSAENPLSLEGPHIEFAWMDEAGLMPRIAWDVVQRRVAHKAGQILITTIPYFDGWLRGDVYDAWIAGDDSIEWIQCKTADNKTYPLEEIERFRRIWTPAKFKRYFEGDWTTVDGLIWPDPSDADCVVDPFVVPDEWPAFSAHDFGMNAPTTGVWGRLSPDDVLYIVADYEATGETIDHHVDRWKQAGLTAVDCAWGDPANPETWQRATELGYPVLKANNSVLAGLDAVYARFVTGRLKIWRNCKVLIDHRRTYRWETAPKDDTIRLDRPKKPQPAEHVCDALRYVVMGVNDYGLSGIDPMVITRGRKMA